ncbi:cell division protein FtsZ [Geobacter sp. OR-1]|uniref:hypothetical protein n=1 Tax=Geobacter sp. OR-1 TaxID=1266765 RepID=UPI000542C8CB|nr:hypothetical protein [Geobacter sp. OR-1]GAM10474.1 cell division protein FtsZ [Geobacter sp. OR-1]
MNRRDFIKGFTIGSLGVLIIPEMLTNLIVRAHANPLLILDPEQENARINVVGIGAIGARIIRPLTNNQLHLHCFEVFFDPKTQIQPDLASVFEAARASDLLFLVSALDTFNSVAIKEALGTAAREAGALVVSIIHSPDGSRRQDWNCTTAYNCWLNVSDACLVDNTASIGAGAFTKGFPGEFSARHLVSAITRLTTVRGMICVDFADIKSILGADRYACLGIGVAGGANKGHFAAENALARVREQGADLLKASGFLALIEGSTLITMQDFEEASCSIHGACNDDVNIICGLIIDETLGANVRVTIIATEPVEHPM